MSESERPTMKVDDAASIKAFLSMIPQPGKPAVSASITEQISDKIGELNVEWKATDTKANTTAASAIQSASASNVASPESKASDTLPPEKVSEWVHENAPPDHFKSKNPLLEAVHAQDSPQASGVNAPPPTPETISNLAIGQIISDELDKIPEERLLSLSDSRWAPKKFSQQSYNRPLSSSEQFLSAVPRSTKPRDDPNFTRMSFQAADTPSAPIFGGSSSGTKPTVKKQLSPQAPSWTPESKENNPLTRTSNAWSQTTTTNRTDEHKPALAPHLRAVQVNESKQSGILTPKPTNAHVDNKKNGVKTEKPDLQSRKPQEDPLSTESIPQPAKERQDIDKTSSPKPLFSFENSDHGYDTSEVPGGLLTPSSMTFGPASPTKVKAAGITTKTEPAKMVGEDLEGALYFKAWPKVEERSTRTGKSFLLLSQHCHL